MRTTIRIGTSVAAAVLLAAAASAAPVVIEDFEFATDNTAAEAGVTKGGTAGATLSVVSGSGADATTGTNSAGLSVVFPANGYEDVYIERPLASPITFSQSYNATNPTATNISSLVFTLDIKGDAAFGASTNGTNIWLFLCEADGDCWRYINFTDAALASATFTDDHRLGLGLIDLESGSTGDGNFTGIASYKILIQNPDPIAKSGTIYIDDLKVEEPFSTDPKIDDYEWVTDNTAAAAGVGIGNDASVSVTPVSGTGANANEGTFSLGMQLNMLGTAFEAGSMTRTLPVPHRFNRTYTAADMANLTVTIDIKGAAAFASTQNTSIWLQLFEADGDIWRYINFSDPALNATTFSDDHVLGTGLIDRDVSSSGDGNFTGFTAYQILIQNPDATAKSGTLYFDDLQINEPPAGPGVIEDFEYADSQSNATTGTTTGTSGSVNVTIDSATGADATEGTYALSVGMNMLGTAFEHGYFERNVTPPFDLGASYTPAELGDLKFTVDVKGDAVFGSSTYGTNIWVRFFEPDGDVWALINFSEPALANPTFTDDLVLGTGQASLEVADGDGLLSSISGWQILIQNPDAVAKNGTLIFDDLKFDLQPDTGLTYVIPLISSAQAPNVTDTTFDAIYDNSGAHPVITGTDWKDWAQRTVDPGAPIGDPIASTSKAYLLTDGDTLYFGMIVYDPNTAAMTSDTGDDTYTKWTVEDVEVAFSALSGAAAPSDAVKFSFDAFGHIDDMMPDSPTGTAIDTTAATNFNSYIIDTNTWAVEFSVGIQELILLSQTNLTNQLQPGPAPWYGHIGYQAPASRVPLYAAAHGNGFANFNITFDTSNFSTASVTDWLLY
ncbi:MAG: hypothetical protein PWP23_1535 [Candidatus Sumerlaeota bacterium]|nr:hypothetical protein [Candidatus Sumerlaeota bacterium]